MASLAATARSEKADQRGGAQLLAITYPEEPRPEDFRLAVGDGLSETNRVGVADEPDELDEADEAGDCLRAWLGNLDDVAVAFGTCRLNTLTDGSRLAIVEWLYVLPEARGVGLGEALMDAILEWATAAGAAGIDSLALPGDRVTKNFFERYGMTARAILVHRQLGAPDTAEA